MARIGGRNLWIAVPAGLLCGAVVAALVWLALPMVPVSVAWLGDTLRAAASRPLAAPQDAPVRAAPAEDRDLECNELYPKDLWSELVWGPQAILSQNRTPPVTAVSSLVEALAPTVRLTCAWRAEAGARTISTTLATVSSEAASIAGAALSAAGFACDTDADATTCVRVRGEALEAHVVCDGFWLSSVEVAWHPEDYTARLAAHLFG